jgi:hypothetical protein
MKLLFFVLMSACSWAQIQHPSIGVMLDEGGSSRPVTGAPAAAILGEPIFKEAAISLACSAGLCLAKTESALLSSTGDAWDAPPGAALIAFNGAAAYVYFVETRRLARWSQGSLDPIDFAPDGDVLSLRASPDGFEYAIGRDDGIWVGDRNLGAANAILLLDGGGALLAADGQVRLLKPDGSEMDFAVVGAESFIGGLVRMSERYVQVITASGMWALDLEPGSEQIYVLPGVSQ